jgi:spermidine synthase
MEIVIIICLFLLLNCQASFECDSFHTYTLNYDAVIERDMWKTFGGVKNGDEFEQNFHLTFTSVSTEIAADIIQIDTDESSDQEKIRVELDRRCYETLMGGGRCNIDHYQVNGTTLQLVTNYIADLIENKNIRLSIEATLMSCFARNTLIKLIPRLNDQLRSFHGMFWTVHKRRTSSQRLEVDHPSSLESMILAQYNLENRMRIASSSSVEVWQYQDESGMSIRALFRDGFLLSTTHVAGIAHAEALVHPALLSGGGEELSVIIISQEPTSILREVLKHNRVKSVFLVGVHRPSLDLAHTYLTSNNNCNFTKYNDTRCFFQPQVRVYDGSVTDWLSTVANSGGINGTFVFVDVPSGNDDWISIHIQSKIREILLGDSVVVIANGSPPKLQDHHQLDARHTLLSQAPRLRSYGGLEYLQVYVYDEVRR